MNPINWKLELGANFTREGSVSFKVWAPLCNQIEIKLLKEKKPHKFLMTEDTDDYFHTVLQEAKEGDSYFYVLNGEKERPDPVSRYQPEGVHGPSAIVNPNDFHWRDSIWKGIPFKDLIFYEIHIGTFTSEGTFEAAIEKISYLKKLGVTCVEIMPVAQFPGTRNWGYDGASLYAVQNSYGGPEGLKQLVNACHRQGLAVCLDVVYNHLGPEGNYLHDFGPYFTKKYHTPWGDTVNYDDAFSEHVRRFIIGNALYWITEYHIDALRLDAIHGIFDFSAKHILEELNDRVQEQAQKLGRTVYVIAESDLNDSKIIRPKRQKGYGLAGQWSDDFHHAVHVYLTGEKNGYYEDFGGAARIAKSITDGFVYDGQYSSFRKKQHGNKIKDLPPEKLVVCIQNHDQVGNRAFGDRLSTLVSFESLKVAAALLILSPYTPLLFMGEEYGERAPFQYFIDHGDPNLIHAVQQGRQEEFASFGWKEIPDPKSEKTFLNSKLCWVFMKKKPHRNLLNLYKDLLKLRKSFSNLPRPNVRINEDKKWLALEYGIMKEYSYWMVFSFSNQEQTLPLSLFLKGKILKEILNTHSIRYGGRMKSSGHRYRNEILMFPHCAIVGRIS